MIRNEEDRQLLARLPGMTVALATPLDDNGSLDRKAFRALIDHVLGEGAAAAFALGWMGEQPALPEKTRRQVMDEVVQHVDGRVPVIIGVSDQSLSRTLEQAEAARSAGADMILATPPYSYRMTTAMIIEYFKQLADKSGMPIILYNNSEAHTPLAAEDVQTVSHIPGVIGIKDFSTFLQLQRLLANVHRDGDFIVWSAEDYFVGPALFLGARYSMLGGPGNLLASWIVSMHRHADAGEWEEVARLHNRLLAFCDTLYGLSESPYSAVKAALAILGFGSGKCVPPLPSLGSAEYARVREVLEHYDLVKSSAAVSRVS